MVDLPGRPRRSFAGVEHDDRRGKFAAASDSTRKLSGAVRARSSVPGPMPRGRMPLACNRL